MDIGKKKFLIKEAEIYFENTVQNKKVKKSLRFENTFPSAWFRRRKQ